MISEFPLFFFTTLAGLAAGAYAVSAVFPVGKDSKRAWLFPLVCLVLLAVGLIALPLHLGRPERMLAALTHPSAMIAQEAYWSMAFGILVLVDLILCKIKGSAPRALRIVGAIAGLGLTFVMANAYFVSTGVPAWATWQTFLLYIFGNLAMGAALLAVFDHVLVKDAKYLLTCVVLTALAVVAFILEAVHFAGVGSDTIFFIVATILGVAAAVMQFLAKSGKLADKMPDKTVAIATFICMLAAVAFARYGFYAACVL